MKANPEDLFNLGEDIKGCIQRHTDAVRANPDIAADLVKVRDKTMERYKRISEGKKRDS